MSRYDDIIGLPHYEPKHHPRMPMENRAAQFAPFAALTGHGAAIAETARLTEQPVELSDEQKHALSRRMEYALKSHAKVSITFFLPDPHKSGGRYIDITGEIKKFDEYSRNVILTDRRTLNMDDITDIRVETPESFF